MQPRLVTKIQHLRNLTINLSLKNGKSIWHPSTRIKVGGYSNNSKSRKHQRLRKIGETTWIQTCSGSDAFIKSLPFMTAKAKLSGDEKQTG
jgi:hypothetical protein